MSTALLAIVVPASIIIIGALLQNSRQNGRIEAGVKGLYDRINRVEGWIDREDDRRGKRRMDDIP